MYPPAFDYSSPSTLEETLATLGQLGFDGRVLAGGQSLIPMMKLRLAAPANLIDINKLTELSYIRSENGHLAIGALARHADVVDNLLVRAASPTMASAAPWVADPLVRNRGTVAGSVAHCDPEGDWNSVMLAVGASVVARSSGSERIIPIGEFVVDFFTNSLAEGEMVTEIRVPKPSGRAGGAYLKLERKIGDYATAAVAIFLQLGDDGTITNAGVALTAVDSKNLKVPDAENLLIGNAPSEDLFEQAATIAAASCNPESDVRGPAEYKRAVVRAYTKRGLAQALSQAQGGA